MLGQCAYVNCSLFWDFLRRYWEVVLIRCCVGLEGAHCLVCKTVQSSIFVTCWYLWLTGYFTWDPVKKAAAKAGCRNRYGALRLSWNAVLAKWFSKEGRVFGALGWALTDGWVRRCWLELLESPAVGCVPLLGGHCYPSVCKPCLELGFELLLLPARHGQTSSDSAVQGCTRQETKAVQELSWELALLGCDLLGTWLHRWESELDRTSSIFQALGAGIPCSPWCSRQASVPSALTAFLGWLTRGTGSTSCRSVLLVLVSGNVLAKIAIPALE